MVRSILLVLVSFFVLSIPVEAQQTDWARLERELQATLKNPQFFDSFLDKLGVQGVRRQIYKDHLDEVFKSPKVISRIIDNMRVYDPTELSGREISLELFVERGIDDFGSLFMKGARRLSVDDQAKMFMYLRNLFNLATPTDCRDIMDESVSGRKKGEIERKYHLLIPPDQLREILSLSRKSVFAELNDFPRLKPFTAAERELAQDLLGGRLDADLCALSNGDQMIEAIINPKSAPPARVCDAAKLIFNSLLSFKGASRALVFRDFFESAQ